MARQVEPRVPLLQGYHGASGGMCCLVAGFVYKRPGKAPSACCRCADACIHGGLSREALKPALRSAVPRDRWTIANDAQAAARDVQVSQGFQTDPARVSLAVLRRGPGG